MKNITTLLFSLAALLAATFASPAYAQQKGAYSEQKTEERSGHLVKILGIDDAHARQFVELYAKCAAEMRAAHQKYPKIQARKDRGAGLTDLQIKQNIENQFALSQTILDIRKKYYNEYLKVLTPRQINRLFELEKKDGDKLRELSGKSRNTPAKAAAKPHGGGKGKAKAHASSHKGKGKAKSKSGHKSKGGHKKSKR